LYRRTTNEEKDDETRKEDRPFGAIDCELHKATTSTIFMLIQFYQQTPSPTVMGSAECIIGGDEMKKRLFRIAAALALFIVFSNGDNINKNSKMSDFNWVIIVKDKKFYPPMYMDVGIDMRAVNTSGNIEGKYTGTAITKFSFEEADASLNANIKSNTLHFSVVPALVPLTKDKNKAFVTDFVGEGEMSSAAGTVVLTTNTGVGKATVPASGNEKIHIIINGTQVKLVIDWPLAPLIFNGYIRGEGKYAANKTNIPSTVKKKIEKIKDEDKLAPLVPAEDDALAPLVPTEDDALAPLVPSGK